MEGNSKPPEEYTDPATDHRLAFEFAYKLGGLQDAEQSEVMADTTILLHLINLNLWNSVPDGEKWLTASTFRETGASATVMCDAVDNSLSGAGVLGSLARKIYDEEIAGPGGSTPLSDRLRSEQRSPYEVRAHLQYVCSEILNEAGETLGQCAAVLASLLLEGGDTATKSLVSLLNRMSSIEFGGSDTAKKESVEGLLQIMRDPEFKGMPQTDLAGLPAATMLVRIAKAYRQWRKLADDTLPDDDMSEAISTQSEDASGSGAEEQPASTPTQAAQPADAKRAVTGPNTESVAQAVGALETELSQLISMHIERSKEFRPSWTKLKNDFRSLELAMRRNLPTGEPLFDQAGQRRLIGIMSFFAELGVISTSDADTEQSELQKHLTNFFIFERAIGANVQKGQETLLAADAEADVSGWVPVEPDMALLHDVWPAVRPLVVQRWPQPGGSSAAIAITNGLRAFNAYRRELARPEEQLKTIAVHIAATALRPEVRLAEIGFTKAQRRRADRATLEEIINNERLHKNTRQRAEVLKHFLTDAQIRQQTENPSDELFYIPPTKDQPTLYFGISLPSWVLIESLSADRASYVFPKRLIEQQGGTLEEFLNTYNKSELVRHGGIQIIHADGWTVDSHTSEIKRRIAAAEMHIPQALVQKPE